MSEPRLGRILIGRFGRLLWLTLVCYAALVMIVFAVVTEVGLRRTLDNTAAVVESLLGLYADPGGERTTVAPAMLADQLLDMTQGVLITRAVSTAGADPALYFLSPNMPAKLIEGLPAEASPDEARDLLVDAIAMEGGWGYHVLHRRAGEFDIVVTGSRRSNLLALLGVGGAALLLLPLTAIVARRGTGRTVATALEPFARLVEETQQLGPSDLSARVSPARGVAEVSELADALNRLVARVERSHRALEAFTADASHELRTPLTRLRTQAQWALTEGRSAEEIQEALSAINREVEQTTKMVEDLLLIARGENRQLAIERRAFDLIPVIHDVEEITQAMADGRDLTVRADVNGPIHARGDATRAREVLLNLASNAVRYTPRGEVTFSCRRDGDRVGVVVRDTGCGISSQDVERIFDRFYRADQSRSRAHGGTGLGLTIARLLAELQGGTITVASEAGRGSEFVFWLPAGDDAAGD